MKNVVGWHTCQADADMLIVSTALAVAESEELPVVVVGTDTDLLVMMVARATDNTDVFMLCHSNPVKVFNIHEIPGGLSGSFSMLFYSYF